MTTDRGAMTQHRLQRGEVFLVSAEIRGADGIQYLRLADGWGWAFDSTTRHGELCHRQEMLSFNSLATATPEAKARDRPELMTTQSPPSSRRPAFSPNSYSSSHEDPNGFDEDAVYTHPWEHRNRGGQPLLTRSRNKSFDI